METTKQAFLSRYLTLPEEKFLERGAEQSILSLFLFLHQESMKVTKIRHGYF